MSTDYITDNKIKFSELFDSQFSHQEFDSSSRSDLLLTESREDSRDRLCSG